MTYKGETMTYEQIEEYLSSQWIGTDEEVVEKTLKYFTENNYDLACRCVIELFARSISKTYFLDYARRTLSDKLDSMEDAAHAVWVELQNTPGFNMVGIHDGQKEKKLIVYCDPKHVNSMKAR